MSALRDAAAETATAGELRWQAARRSLMFTFGGYCLHESWFDGLELLTHVTRIATSIEETSAAVIPLLQDHAAVVVPSHPVAEPPARLTLTDRFIRYSLTPSNHYLVHLGGSFDDYLHRLQRGHRHEIQRKLRRYREVAGARIGFSMYSSPQEAGDFYPLARALSAKTYQDRLLRVGLPGSGAFLAELRGYAERGEMRGYILFHREQPIAYAYCAAAEHCLRFVFTGYDPAFAAWSPGIVLVHEMLRSICSEGRYAVLDLGPGEAQYKRLFATGSLLCATLLFFRPTPGPLMKVAAHCSCIAASDICAATAERLGIKDRLRRLVRTWTVLLGVPFSSLAIRDVSDLWPVCDIAQQLIEALP